jgi:hypothetical protein
MWLGSLPQLAKLPCIMATSTNNNHPRFNIQGLDKADLILAMWEKLEFCDDYLMRPVPPVLTRERALAALTEDEGYVFILCGKFIKTNFSSDVEVDGTVYDQLAGAGTMKAIVENLRKAQTAPVLHAVLNAARVRRLQKPSIKKVEQDGACFWRCVLDSIPDSLLRSLLLLPADGPALDFASAPSADVFPVVDKLRTMTAEFVKQLETEDPDEYTRMKEGVAEGDTLEQWMCRMQQPIGGLEFEDRYATDLTVPVTSLLFRKLGIDLDIEVAITIYTDKDNNVVRELTKPTVPRIDVNLAYLKRDKGQGYHFDRVIDKVRDETRQEEAR